MTMSWKSFSALMIILGIVYLIKPNIFRVGIWKETDIAQRAFTPKQYNRYMRILGLVLIAIGAYVIIKNN